MVQKRHYLTACGTMECFYVTYARWEMHDHTLFKECYFYSATAVTAILVTLFLLPFIKQLIYYLFTALFYVFQVNN